jgi:hypothetical protein
MQVRKNQVFMFLAIVGFFLLTRNLFLLKFVSSPGYTVDIYSMFPLTFYLSFIASYFIATLIILYNYKKLGVFILCLNHLEILLIPYMLGYYSMGRADDMSYIGEYLQIVKSGHFADWNIYPASNTLGAFISLLSNIEAPQVSFIIPIVFSFIFILGVNLFSKELISNSFICSLVLVSSFILYLGVYNFLNVPHALFFALMPLYLCYFYKYLLNSKNVPLSIIFVLMTLTIPFTHPFIVFFVFSVFLLHMVPITLSISPLNMFKIPQIKMSSFLLIVIVFAHWFISTKLLKYSKQSYLAFVNKITEPVFFDATEKISRASLNFFDYLQLISFFYGRYVIPTIFIIISFIFLHYNKKFLKIDMLKEYPYLIILYIASIILQLILLFNPIISHQPDRIMNLNFIVYSQIPLFSYALYFIFFKDSIVFKKILQVCVILTFIWSLSLFGCLDSPNVYRTNAALTCNEVNGMSWFYQVKDDSSVSTPLSQINRFYDLFGTPEKSDIINHFPDHFGYVNESDTFEAINLGEDSTYYVVILTIDELLYQKVPGYMDVGRYNSSDFIKFRKDSSVNKIYDSLNIEIFKSHAAN